MCDTWSAGGVQNAFEQVTKITQLQSEAGAAGGITSVSKDVEEEGFKDCT